MTHMSASEAMVETLRLEGVQEAFGIVGSAFMDALDLFPAAGIRFFPVRHEQSAAHMADGFARVTGRPTICIGQNGPGITNMVTAIAAAWHAHTPLVLVTPSAMSSDRGKDGFQEADQLPIFRTITKYQVQVPRADRIAESFRTAFRVALAEHGPVQVDVPRDYLYAEIDTTLLDPKNYRVAALRRRRPGVARPRRRAARRGEEPRRARRLRRDRLRRRRRGAPRRPPARRAGRHHLHAHRRVPEQRRARRRARSATRAPRPRCASSPRPT